MKRLIAGILLTQALLFADTLKTFPKEYYSLKRGEKLKSRFVEILYPLILKEEEKILKERKFVESFFAKFESVGIVTPVEVKKLEAIAKKYRIKSLYDKEEYLKRVDTIPVSMVLAQAAIESSWGKSRFVRKANNLFGEWTWGKRGIIPKNRPKGKRYKIRIFNSLQDSIASYMRNLNRHWAYKEFREARYLARKMGKPFGGFTASAYLTRYSQLGEKYTLMIKKTIDDHEWDLYDIPKSSSQYKVKNEMVMLSKEIMKNINAR